LAKDVTKSRFSSKSITRATVRCVKHHAYLLNVHALRPVNTVFGLPSRGVFPNWDSLTDRQRVLMKNVIGSMRIVDMFSGEQLSRIC
jgi:hypothetical protein